MDSNHQPSNGGIQAGVIVGGAFLLVVGGTMYLERAGIGDVQVQRIIGPACLIIIGTLMLLDRRAFVVSKLGKRQPDGTEQVRVRRHGTVTGGLWLVGVGCWMLASQFELFGLDYRNSWPLLIILSGIIMLVRGVR
jgi:hypothetical protein